MFKILSIISCIIIYNVSLFANQIDFNIEHFNNDLNALILLDQSYKIKRDRRIKIENEILKSKYSNNSETKDSVESYILKKYSDQPFKKYMFLEANKTIEQILLLPLDKKYKNKYISLYNKLLNIYTCIDYIDIKNKNIDKNFKLKKEFKRKVFNTSEKLNRYIKYQKMFPLNYINNYLFIKNLHKDKMKCLKTYHKFY